MAIKESTHWYSLDGKPAYTVTGKNGKERNTTLRDARTMNLAPSVTTIMSVAAKPALENWKIDQALMAALTLPREENESLDDFMKRAKSDSKEQAIQAAQRGTEIHAMVERGFSEGKGNTAFRAVFDALKALYPLEPWIAEESFCSGGFGGKVDLYSPNGIVVDFKTKDGLCGKDPKKLVYDEHGMQLSAYAMGLGFETPIRISVFIDRSDPELVLTHHWDSDSHLKHSRMFLALLDYWQLVKGYSALEKKEQAA